MALGRHKRTFLRHLYDSIYWRVNNAWLKNPIRTYQIASKQNQYMQSTTVGNNNRVIIFLVPGYDEVNGGVMSILSLADETERLKNEHGADVFVCSMPTRPALLKYTKFTNTRTILNFETLLQRYNKNTDILVHIPENAVCVFYKWAKKRLLKKKYTLRFNVMLQNIELMPTLDDLQDLKNLGLVTVTTAHKAYSGAETEKMLGCPVHHFSVWISPEKYERELFAERENIFVLSPDQHPRRKEIVQELSQRLPEFKFITVKGITYQEYKKLISSAKFSLTFGEGLDGYYAEIIFSGGIGCAVYNNKFFTNDFENVPFIYPTWDDLLARLPEDVRTANTPTKYDYYHSIPYHLLCNQYSYNCYQDNIRTYYCKYFPLRELA